MEQNDSVKTILDQCFPTDELGLKLQRIDIHQIVFFNVVLHTEKRKHDKRDLRSHDAKEQPKSKQRQNDRCFKAQIVKPLFKVRLPVVLYGLFETNHYSLEIQEELI